MPRHTQGHLSWAALSVVFLLSLPAVTTRFYASDEIQFFSWLRSIAFDRDVDFQNEYQYFYDTGPAHNDGFRDTFLTSTNEAGRRRNFAPIGCAILWAPFYAAGHVVALITGAPADGLSRPYIAAVAYGSAVYGFLALLLSLAIVRHVVGGSAMSTVAVVATWIGTPLVFYMYVAPGFGHACSAFAVSLFLWVWLRVRERWTMGGVALLAAIGALLPMVREQDVFFVAGPALDALRTFAWPSARPTVHASRGAAGLRRLLTLTLAGAAAFIVVYAPQLLAYNALNGHPSATTAVTRKMIWTSPHLAGVLFSPEHGLFFWTPLALIAVLGLVWLASGRSSAVHADAAWIGVIALVMFAAQAYISGSVDSWTVAGSFGQRRFVATTPLIALGLATIGASIATRPLRLVALATAVLALWWNVGLMLQFGLHTMDRQRLTLASNARATFVDLPRQAPSILWRYFTNRSSFYGVDRR